MHFGDIEALEKELEIDGEIDEDEEDLDNDGNDVGEAPRIEAVAQVGGGAPGVALPHIIVEQIAIRTTMASHYEEVNFCHQNKNFNTLFYL